MPLGIIVIAIGAVGIIAALATYASARTITSGGKERGNVPPLALPPSALPPAGVEVPKDVAIALEAIGKGTATPDILANGAQAAAEAGLNSTANGLSNQLDKLINTTIPAIVKAPNKPATPIPNDPITGKSLWFVEDRGGVTSAIPRFGSVMEQFKSLQRALGVSADGRIGPGTLAAFKSRTSTYLTAPKDIGVLAANVVKWTEIIRLKSPVAEVGARPFREAPADENPAGAAWRSFVKVNESEMLALVPKVRHKLGNWIGMKLPGSGQIVTLSGLMGLASKAGIRGAAKWLNEPSDRVRYPHTTKVFQQTNGLF